MSEKVILTQEQDTIIKRVLKNRNGDRAQLLEDHAKMRGCWIADYRVLDELTVSDMARVIYDDEYEVEQPKFKVGDKVTLDGLGEVLEISNIYDVSGTPFCNFENMAGVCYLAGVRHATPEEIYWLHELGREKVPDFKVGDVFVDGVNSAYLLNNEQKVKDFMEYYNDDDFTGIYPAESFKPFKKEQTE